MQVIDFVQSPDTLAAVLRRHPHALRPTSATVACACAPSALHALPSRGGLRHEQFRSLRAHICRASRETAAATGLVIIVLLRLVASVARQEAAEHWQLGREREAGQEKVEAAATDTTTRRSASCEG